MYKTFFYHKEFLKKFIQTIRWLFFSCRQHLREIVTFVSMRQKRVYMTVSSDLATDNRVHRSCTVLETLGFQVYLIGRQKKNSPQMPERFYSVRRIKLYFEKGALFYANLNLRLFFILLFQKYEYIFANDLDTLPAAYLMSRIKRKPILYDSHELFTEVPELTNRPRIQKIWSAIERFILPHLKEMCTVNQSIATIFKHKYQLGVSVVRNVPQKLESIAILSKSELGLTGDQKMLIIQGSGLNVQRGIEEAVLAMASISNAVLFLVGDGDVIPEIKKLVTNHSLQEKVRFVPRLPYPELMRYTASADLGLALDKPLSLNYQLALPNKVFDYIQAQTPIVSSRLVEIERLIQKHDCGEIIDTVSPEAIAACINALLTNPQRLQQLKANCKKAAEIEHWGIDKEVLAALALRIFV
jgi:glycosyltransferase involved in cell wall biosynthesis